MGCLIVLIGIGLYAAGNFEGAMIVLLLGIYFQVVESADKKE